MKTLLVVFFLITAVNFSVADETPVAPTDATSASAPVANETVATDAKVSEREPARAKHHKKGRHHRKHKKHHRK